MSDVMSPATRDLITACRSGKVALASAALEGGADITNYRPLWTASEMGHTEVVKLLLKYGANVNKAHPKFGSTPLFQASEMGRTKVVQLLLDYNADVNKATIDMGFTPLYAASQMGYTDVVNLLLQHGANPNIVETAEGSTPLLIASQQGHHDVAMLLLNYGADPNIARYDGKTPLFFAKQNGYRLVEMMLENFGAQSPTNTSVRPSGARALPVQSGAKLSTDFTTAHALGVGAPRRAKEAPYRTELGGRDGRRDPNSKNLQSGLGQ